MKRLFVLLIVLGLVFVIQAEKIRLSEVVRSVFYAPQYVAIEKGFFAEEGLEIDLSTAWGADKGAAATISGQVDIGFFGPEAGIYIYNEGASNHLVAFAQLTAMDGSFLVARNTKQEFKWTDLKGKTIIGGRVGGVPEMTLEYVLKKYGYNLKNDVNVITNLAFTATAGAFQASTGDYIALFEPTATLLEKEGVGKIVASLGVEGGPLPYTVYHVRLDYLKKNPALIQRFTNAILKGQLWVATHSAKDIATVIIKYFPEIELGLLIQVVDRYKSQNTWNPSLLMSKDSFDRLQTIMELAGELKKRAPYEKLVDNSFALKALETISLK